MSTPGLISPESLYWQWIQQKKTPWGTIHLACIRSLLYTQMNHAEETLSFGSLIKEIVKGAWTIVGLINPSLYINIGGTNLDKICKSNAYLGMHLFWVIGQICIRNEGQGGLWLNLSCFSLLRTGLQGWRRQGPESLMLLWAGARANIRSREHFQSKPRTVISRL